MTYTVSHRQAGAQRSAVAGLVRHEFRDVDRSNGIETSHSNERIVHSRTHLNRSWMWVDGKRQPITDTRQVTQELDRRLEGAGGTRINKKTGEVTRIAVRQDAKVVRDIVLQLDPTFTRSSEHLTSDATDPKQLDQVREHLEQMIEHYGDLYGHHNLLAASLHLDETSPHVHLLVTPIDDDGRVRQESFIKGRQAMRDNDRAMRSRLASGGYDVDPAPRGANRSHLSIDEYAQHQERLEELRAREVAVEDRESRLEWAETRLKGSEGRLERRERDVDLREAEAVKAAQRAAEARSGAIAEAERLQRDRAALLKRREALDELDAQSDALLKGLKAGTVRIKDKAAMQSVNEGIQRRNAARRRYVEIKHEAPVSDDPQPGA